VWAQVRVTRHDENARAGDDVREMLIKDKLVSGQYFGEMALLEEGGLRMATVTANEDTVLMSLSVEKFIELVGSVNEQLGKEVERRQREMDRAQTRDPIKMIDLETIKVLGVGTFGRVKLVKHKTTGVRT
jgi:CRP-like cAMP-binding protein